MDQYLKKTHPIPQPLQNKTTNLVEFIDTKTGARTLEYKGEQTRFAPLTIRLRQPYSHPANACWQVLDSVGEGERAKLQLFEEGLRPTASFFVPSNQGKVYREKLESLIRETILRCSFPSDLLVVRRGSHYLLFRDDLIETIFPSHYLSTAYDVLMAYSEQLSPTKKQNFLGVLNLNPLKVKDFQTVREFVYFVYEESTFEEWNFYYPWLEGIPFEYSDYFKQD